MKVSVIFTGRMISLVVIVSVIVQTVSLSTNCISYAKIGKTATFKCLFQTVDIWAAGIGTRNSTTYAIKRKVNAKLQIAKRLSVSEDYSLIIKNVSRSDFQTYRCTGYNYSQLETYDIVLNERIDPSNIRIIEETEPQSVIGVIGQNMSITCTVTSGEPEETLIIEDDKRRKMAKGGPGSVKLQLEPDHNDDGRNFTCLVMSCDEQVLSYTVQLNIRYKPNITIQAYPHNTTMEGDPLELRCNDREGSTNVISGYNWQHNGKYLQHSLKVMQLNVTTRMDNGNFTCTAENEAGEARDTIEINVLYAPVIENYSVSFFENNSNLLVSCKVSGNPNNFTFGEWIHLSDVDTPIRYLNGSEDGMLAISSFTGTAEAYENGGVYVCNVSNGIHSTDGSLWQTGKIHVIIKESPVFTKQNKPEQVGYIDNTSSLFVDVMRSSRIMSTKWYIELSEVLKTERLTMPRKSLIIKAQFHNKIVYTKGYRCNLTIDKTKPEDFQNYKVTVQNQYGFSSFIIQLRYAGPPRMPHITTVKRTSNGILVKWESVFDGGYETTYEVEYRKVTETKWDRIHIKENHLSTTFIADPNTDYLVRMKALNKMGNSSSTKEQTVPTEDKEIQHSAVIYGTSVFTVIMFCISGVFGCFWCYSIIEKKKRMKANNHDIDINQDQQLAEDNGVVNDNNIPEINIIPPAENNINVNVLQGAFGINVLQGAFGESCEGYSSIDRRKRISMSQKVSYMANRSTKVVSTEL
ncbi:cell adhesion molecule DSCAM-like [Mytilus californianus]|uniref:cell adhesion molecule DSCAM-like n=1 Tax=Mytilus californianus TaxID=6549 RepID=UPI0022460F0B|nr:cell adhesion molecule DSCAM-like [Mytilus californianus]